jgi:hypothetical protein
MESVDRRIALKRLMVFAALAGILPVAMSLCHRRCIR